MPRRPQPPAMTGPQFRRWLAVLRSRYPHRYPSNAAVGVALGRNASAIGRYTRTGVPLKTTALACTALIDGMEPYPSSIHRRRARWH